MLHGSLTIPLIDKLIDQLKKKGGPMGTQSLAKLSERMPTYFDDLFKPWNEWFNTGGSLMNRTFSMPSVNITETDDAYNVSVAVPGMKKEDFRIDIDGNMLTIACEKEESKEEKEKKFTRKEYNYSSFSRSFTLPDEVNREKIDASYTDGILKLALPRKQEVKKPTAKQIAVK
jgi:HSP20 family protein